MTSSTIDDKNVVADDLSIRRNDSDNPNGTSRNGGDELDEDVESKDFGLKSNPSSLIDNIDSIPYIPDIIPDLKHDDVQVSISPTFYAQIFCTKVFWKLFFYLQFEFVILC